MTDLTGKADDLIAKAREHAQKPLYNVQTFVVPMHHEVEEGVREGLSDILRELVAAGYRLDEYTVTMISDHEGVLVTVIGKRA